MAGVFLSATDTKLCIIFIRLIYSFKRAYNHGELYLFEDFQNAITIYR